MSSKFFDEVDRLDAEAQKVIARCADGDLVFRVWSATSSTHRSRLLLVHGGSGSWTHWYKNISFLREHFEVYTVDLPGLGNSARLPVGYTAADAVAVVEQGIRDVFADNMIHVAAFSWGCAVMSQVVSNIPAQFCSLTLVGPASLGDIPRRGGMQPLVKKTPDMNIAQENEANRTNLARLMLFDKNKIDDLAVYLQTENTRRARFNSPQFSRTRLTLDGIATHEVPLQVIYGSEDASAKPDVASKEQLFREVRPDVSFQLVPDGGHWLQYEKPEVFHSLVLEWTDQNEL